LSGSSEATEKWQRSRGAETSLKASLLLKNIDHARDSLAGLDLSDERDRLKECLDLLEDNRHGGLDVEMRIVSDLLLTKPKL
jgi:hypothetical protein